ncbi:cell adhesion molecule 4-like [Haliotis asinina]|uniref:cell adhesion molecule 4-like n=1 Tax=Haliotis asinina TaxID=109174 RepID=UPI0035319B97
MGIQNVKSQGLASMTTRYPHTTTRVGEGVTMTMNPDNVSFLYFIWLNGSVAERLLLIQPISHRVVVLYTTNTGNTTRIRYTGEDSPSQTGQLRFTIYNVTVQDAGTYYCQGSIGQEVTGCRQVLVVAQTPTTPTITGPVSPVSGENVTLTCSSSSRSLPPDHHPLTMTYIWRRDRTLLESGDESPTGGDDLTITHVSRENQGDTYSCQAVEGGLESDWSHRHVLDVLYGPDQIHFDGTRDKLQVEEGKPVTERCFSDCNPACTVTWWNTSRQVVMTGHRKAVLYIPAVDVSMSRQYMCHVNNTHGSASRNLTLDVFSCEVTESGVVSIVSVAVVCSILIVVIAVVDIVVVCRKHRRGGNQDNRCGECLTAMAERLSHDFSDVPRASNNDVLPLHDYERLLGDQFHVYTSFHPSSSSTEDHSTR